VLHGLRLKGLAEEPAIERLTGLPRADVDTQLAKLEADGLVRHRAGKVSGWSLTAAGRADHTEAITADVAAAGCRREVKDLYEAFLLLNPTLLSVCTDWQVRPPAGGHQQANDHSDAGYDDDVVVRLGVVDAAVQPVCAQLGSLLDRCAHYGPRLTNARVRVERGERQWFTGAAVDSYHAVWFELHEDLLATLGITRGTEVGS